MSLRVRAPVRWLAAVALLAVTAAMCLAVQVVFGRSDASITTVASIVAISGILSAQRVVPSRRAAAHFMLAFGAVLSVVLLMGIPMPPVSHEATLSAFIVAGSLAIAGCASILMERRPRTARALVALLSLYGVTMIASVIRWTAGQVWQDGPAVTISRTFGVLLAATWVVASWSVSRITRDVRPHRIQRQPDAHA